MPQRPIRDIIEGRSVLTASLAATVADTARLMKKHGASAVLVLDRQRLAGIFTERDALFRVIAEGLDPRTTALSAVMTPNPQTSGADRPFAHALLMMHEGGFRHVPIVKAGRPVGMVSARDALALEWTEFESELERREQIGASLG